MLTPARYPPTSTWLCGLCLERETSSLRGIIYGTQTARGWAEAAGKADARVGEPGSKKLLVPSSTSCTLKSTPGGEVTSVPD